MGRHADKRYTDEPFIYLFIDSEQDLPLGAGHMFQRVFHWANT